MIDQRFVRASGAATVVGGLLWFASVAWYAQQPIADDGLKEGWESFNRFITLTPALFASSIVTISVRHLADPPTRWPLAVCAVLSAPVIMAFARLLVDLGMLASPFSFVAIVGYTAAFLWWLVDSVRARTFSRPPLITLLLTTLLMLEVIGTDSVEIWLAAPLAVARIWIGYALFRHRAGGNLQVVVELGLRSSSSGAPSLVRKAGRSHNRHTPYRLKKP